MSPCFVIYNSGDMINKRIDCQYEVKLVARIQRWSRATFLYRLPKLRENPVSSKQSRQTANLVQFEGATSANLTTPKPPTLLSMLWREGTTLQKLRRCIIHSAYALNRAVWIVVSDSTTTLYCGHEITSD